MHLTFFMQYCVKILEIKLNAKLGFKYIKNKSKNSKYTNKKKTICN